VKTGEDSVRQKEEFAGFAKMNYIAKVGTIR